MLLSTSFGLKVRSKSEIIIAEKLYEKSIPFQYEKPLLVRRKRYYPDFTILLGRLVFYWEHFGMLHDKEYAQKTKIKLQWYEKHFPNKLICTSEHPDFALQVHNIVEQLAKFI